MHAKSHAARVLLSLRRHWLAAAALAIVPVSIGAALTLSQPSDADAQPILSLASSSPLNVLDRGGPWLNSTPLGPQQLRGKVVVVGFWTYSCINSLRALPYLRAWSATYKDRGLVVIGVHTPEFAFEKVSGNVRRAASELGVDFPVELDSDSKVWDGLGNNAWPAFYVFDAQGRLRGQAIGEGDYERIEQLVRRLLSETPGALPPSVGDVTATGAEAAADLADLASAESYIGYGQANVLAAAERLIRDQVHPYQAPQQLALNRWSLDGEWTVGREYTTLDAPSGSIANRFHARDLHMVLAPAGSDRPVRFRLTIDGRPPGADHGADVDADGYGAVREPRMYQLIRQRQAVRDRTAKIEFLDAGLRAYVFTYG